MSLSAVRENSLLGLLFPQLEELLEREGVRPFHARVIWQSLYRELEERPGERVSFQAPLQSWFGRNPRFQSAHPLEVRECIESGDGLTRKMLLGLEDGHAIETVVMDYPGRSTACLSTQVGCAMGCVFCATGQMGFVRNLSAGEIVAQVVLSQRLLKSRGAEGLRNLVLMGMGEPLHNYDAVMQALDIVCDQRGLGLGARHVAVSTVGLVPAMLRFAREKRPYCLAVSLHAATDEERSALLPVNQRWPLAELLDACREVIAANGRKMFFGWTLIEGRNDSAEDARRVAALLRGLNAHVNLIRLNPTRGFGGVSAGQAAADQFRRIIQESGLPCTIRQFRGIDVDAGCGQLRSSRQKQPF